MSILSRPRPFYFTNFAWNVESPLNADHETYMDPNIPFNEPWFLLLDNTNFLLLDGTNFLLSGE